MAYFPVYVELDDKQCTVIGGGTIATKKIRKLLEFGAKVVVIAPVISDELQKLQIKNKVTIIHKDAMVQPKRKEDRIGGAAFRLSDEVLTEINKSQLVIAGTNKSMVNKMIWNVCKNKNIPVNVVDDRDLCTFYFPSYVKRGDLVVGVSTGGKSPLLASKLRRKLEKVVTPDYGIINERMGEARSEIMSTVSGYDNRKEALEEKLLEIIDELKEEKELAIDDEDDSV
ncbi:MAG: bifunctional precorrin-2 dehydrogenase/sirohydrochlorin ferrochelatase [Lachnospiraceae bacterium]|nr:bifunctional precorrin-2 dehydrogenase/sirohydrochlorin ferrochelatase [Lachnospiraceae bacterium]MEE3460620.1 bifunctional precorrin-2 dehydrogenase/sirohydrochlorin ferrochelatase [Lachnospiraceae bacterium]